MAIDLPDHSSVKSTQASPKHILDLLKNAALTANGKGLSYLDNGINEAPVVVSYSQLYEDAKVSNYHPRCSILTRHSTMQRNSFKLES